MRTKALSLDKVRIDGGTQVRVEIDQPTVDSYAELMAAGLELDPIQVFFDGSEHWLWDGFHRFHAARKAGLKELAAEVGPGTKQEAVWASLAANKKHGKPLTAADRANAVQTALRLHPNHSDRLIAEHIGVHYNTVAKYRSQMVDVGTITNCDSRVGSDGRTTNVGNIGRPTAGDFNDDIPFDPPPAARHSATSEPTHAPQQEDENQEISPADGYDFLGNTLTDRIAGDFARRGELNAILQLLSKARKAVEKAVADKDRLFADLNVSAFMADIANAYRRLAGIRPYALCSYCKGDGCRACNNRGWLCKTVYDAVPEDMK